MMDCAHYRRSLLADPHESSPERLAHRESCSACEAYTERVLQFESRVERAMHVDAAARAVRTPASRFTAYRKGWPAMAASVLVAALVAGALWLASPRPSLAADVVAHMAGEPQAWLRTDVPVRAAALQAVLRDSHVRLAAGPGVVSYASSCDFRDHRVPHLVMQTEQGPVTVMVLVNERVSNSTRFEEKGYRGVIVPAAGHGSLAVLARGPAMNMRAVQSIAAQVLNSIVWTS